MKEELEFHISVLIHNTGTVKKPYNYIQMKMDNNTETQSTLSLL